MTFAWVTLLGIAPSCVQRFMSVPTLRKSKLYVFVYLINIGNNYLFGNFSELLFILVSEYLLQNR